MESRVVGQRESLSGAVPSWRDVQSSERDSFTEPSLVIRLLRTLDGDETFYKG